MLYVAAQDNTRKFFSEIRRFIFELNFFFFSKILNSIVREIFSKGMRSTSTLIHEVIFSIKQKNIQELDSLLLELSDPENSKFQQWLSQADVGNMIRNPGSSNVTEWLESEG